MVRLYRSNTLSRAVSELAAEAQTLPDPARFPELLLTRLQPVLGFDSALCMALGPRKPVAHLNKAPYLRLIQKVIHMPALFDADLQRGRTAGLQGDGAYLDEEVFTASERRERPFFAEVIRPQGITSQLVGYLRFRDQPLAALHFCRHGRSRGFRRKELDALRGVLPMLGLAHAALSRTSPASPASPRIDEGLSAREQEIVNLVRQGLTNREIGALLGSSPNTVRNQLHRLFAKLGVAGRTELAVWFGS